MNDLAFPLADTWQLDVTCHDGDFNPLDLTDAVIALRVGAAGVPLISLDSEADADRFQIVDLATAGRVLVTVKPEDQADLAAGVYDYELRVVLPGDVISHQLRGTINATPSLFA